MKLQVLTSENLAFLKGITQAVLEDSLAKPEQILGELGPNKLGFTFVLPGGRNCYPSFWTRDFVMSLESGLINTEIARSSFICLAEHQAKTEMHIKHGAVIPKGSLPDHIRPDGLPIYFPGTYDYDEQGYPMWGVRPPFDDNFYFIENAYLTPGISFTLYQEQLEDAFQAVPVEEEGLLVECSEEARGVNWGFVDSINHTGKLLFASLLRELAAKRLAFMFSKAGNENKSKYYEQLSQNISVRIETVFTTENGLLKASTGNSNQLDVWGSAFAVYNELVSPECQMRISKAMADELRRGQISWKGQICHVPLDHAGSPDSLWDHTPTKKNEYQNGAYWGTATGWVAYTVALSDETAANNLFAEYLDELKENDFRKGPGFNAPWECVHPTGNYCRNAIYLTSVSCPYAAALKILQHA